MVDPYSPLISIITVTLNASAHLEKAIQSLISQDYDNYELIVIDGGSTDNTVDIIKHYQSHISYWHSQPDGGANQAYNIGVQKTKGELIAFLNADDWYEPGILKKVAAQYQQQPTDVITCYVRIVKQLADNKLQQLALFNSPQATSMSIHNILFGNPLTNGRFYHRRLFEAVGFLKPYFEGQYLYSADREWFIRLALHKPSNAVVKHLGYTYLAHAGSITLSGSQARKKQGLQEHLNIMKSYLAHSNLSRGEQKLFEWWHCDQSLRLCYYDFLLANKKAAWIRLKQLFRYYPFKSLSTMIKLPLLLLRKLYLHAKI